MKKHLILLTVSSLCFLIACQQSEGIKLEEANSSNTNLNSGFSTEMWSLADFYNLNEEEDALIKFSFGVNTIMDAQGGGNDFAAWHTDGWANVYAIGNETNPSFSIGTFSFDIVSPESTQDPAVFHQVGESEFKSEIFGNQVQFQGLGITETLYIPEPIYCITPAPDGLMDTRGIPVAISQNLQVHWNKDDQNLKGVIIMLKRSGNQEGGPLFYFEVFEDDGEAEIASSVLSQFAVGSHVDVSLIRGNYLQETYGEEDKLLTLFGNTAANTLITLTN